MGGLTECPACGAPRRIYCRGVCRRCYERRLRERNPDFAERQRRNSREWRARNLNRVREHEQSRRSDPQKRARDARTKRLARYRTLGITEAQAAAALAAGCVICGAKRHLHLDHDHKTGRFRGVLCSKHNNGLGFLGDDIEGLEAALAYLRSAPHIPEEKT